MFALENLQEFLFSQLQINDRIRFCFHNKYYYYQSTLLDILQGESKLSCNSKVTLESFVVNNLKAFGFNNIFTTFYRRHSCFTFNLTLIVSHFDCEHPVSSICSTYYVSSSSPPVYLDTDHVEIVIHKIVTDNSGAEILLLTTRAANSI